MRSLALQQIALSVRQRADLGGQQNAYGGNSGGFVVDQELLSDINAAVGTVWDILTEKFPSNYSYGYDGNPTGIGYFFPIVQGVYQYNLPFDFYKEKGVDLSLDASLQNWSTMRPYTLRDRNLFSYPLQTVLAYAGWQNMRWQIVGNQISFLPKQGPLPGIVRLLYATAAPILCASLPSAYANNTAYAQNSLIYTPIEAENGKIINQVFLALAGGTSSTLGLNVGLIGSNIYYTVGPNIPVSITQNTGGVAGVAVAVTYANGQTSGQAVSVAITITTASLTVSQVTSMVNASSAASQWIAAAGSGGGAAGGGTLSLTPWNMPGTVTDNNILWAYQGPMSLFATTLDGISGYEELVILDAAIKVGIKEETDVSALMAQKAEWIERIEYAAANRNSGDPMVVSGGFGQTEGGTNYGGGFGPWSGGGW
jgi:hypothetical protein